MAVMESVSTINSVVRTFIALVLVGGISAGSWFGYSAYRSSDLQAKERAEALATAQEKVETLNGQLVSRQQELTAARELVATKEKQIVVQGEAIDTLEKDVAEKIKDIERLDTSLRLLKVDRRVGRISVLEQGVDDEGEQFSRIQFVEVDQDGNHLDEPREFKLEGDVMYVDYWVVKFDEKYVEQADLHRATSIVLFRRIFGEFQEPTDGFQLDEAGSRPTVYARAEEEPSEFETKIWGDFWSIANDPAQAADLGVRAAHGEAVSIKLQQGRRYKLMLRASDGLSIQPDGRVPTNGG